MDQKLTTVAKDYFAELRRIRASGGATDERSTYGPLANLLNAVGGTLKPKVFCVGVSRSDRQIEGDAPRLPPPHPRQRLIRI